MSKVIRERGFCKYRLSTVVHTSQGVQSTSERISLKHQITLSKALTFALIFIDEYHNSENSPQVKTTATCALVLNSDGLIQIFTSTQHESP